MNRYLWALNAHASNVETSMLRQARLSLQRSWHLLALWVWTHPSRLNFYIGVVNLPDSILTGGWFHFVGSIISGTDSHLLPGGTGTVSYEMLCALAARVPIVEV